MFWNILPTSLNNREMKYFDIKEFDSPDLPGSGNNMDREFLKKLDTIRDECNFPLVIESGYRTKHRNKEVGGSIGSSHTRGFAADIKVADSFQRFKLIGVAIKHGIKRIGINKTTIHIDTDKQAPQNVFWHYYK